MNTARTATQSEVEAVRRYLFLMVELATRIDLVAAAMGGGLNLAPQYARELAYFQFRRMCEIIALGCLILHGDIPAAQTGSVRKIWNADKIMRLLHGLHPHFFPQAIVRTQSGKSLEISANTVPGALTRVELQKLYAECGEVLHRGTIASLELVPVPSADDYAKVNEWQSKIVKLMQEYIITRKNVVGLYLVSLRTTAGGPQCSIFNFDAAGRMAGVSTVTVTTASQEARKT